ncbi:hypothetical protein BH10ACT10_BH10ACT10_16680 [soil metagenome]
MVAPHQESLGEVDVLREELRLCRLELAQVQAESERVLEDHARVRRGRRKAQKEAAVLARALAEVLYRELRQRVEGGGRWGRRRSSDQNPGSVSQDEWQQVMLLHRARHFHAAWYLRQNLTVARQGIEPALHFLRFGVIEGRDPGPHFDVRDYLLEHPDVRASGQNPVVHAISAQDLDAAARRTPL